MAERSAIVPCRDAKAAMAFVRDALYLPSNIAMLSFRMNAFRSSGAVNRPSVNPARRFARLPGVSSGAALTGGLPAFAITNGSPSAAASTGSAGCVFASRMLTDFMRTSGPGPVSRKP